MSRPKRQQQRNKNKKANASDWQQLTETPALREAFLRFAQSVQVAQEHAESVAPGAGLTASQVIDLRDAGRILDQHPQLVSYLLSIRERQEALSEAESRPNALLKSSPMSNQAATGSWSAYNDRSHPQGISNARILRDFVDESEWVAAAVNYYCDRISRADIAVLPEDERRPYDRKTEKAVTHILNHPNEFGDTFPDMLSGFIRDHITLGRGTLTKNMDARRIASALYLEDASFIKIYPQWSGDPQQPRYLYQQNAQSKIPLLNDEVICMFYGYSSFRYSFSPIQILRNTILADVKATESASRLVDQKPPPHVIQLPGASPTQIKEVSAAYTNEIAGRREVLFLGGPNPAQIKPMIYSLRDNQWMEWLEYLALKIFAVLGLSPQDFGMTADINKATAASQQDISENKGLIPTMLRTESCLNRGFLADFAPKKQGRRDLSALNLRLIFPEISEAARMLHVEKAIGLAEKSLAGLPSSTINNILAMMGEEPIPGGNTLYVLTANGAVPWLSYDGDLGSYVSPPPMAEGTQDSDGGIDETSDEDMGSNDASNNNDVSGNQSDAGASETSGDVGTEESMGSDETQKTFIDTRVPGRSWNPASHRLKKIRGARKATPPTLSEDKAARSQLTATVQRIFKDVEKQGAEKLRGMQ